MKASPSLNLTTESHIYRGLESKELTHVLDMPSDLIDISPNPDQPCIVYDEDNHIRLKKFVGFLQDRYGKRNVVGSSLNYDINEDHPTDVKGQIGIYVTTAALLTYEWTSFVDSLPVAESTPTIPQA